MKKLLLVLPFVLAIGAQGAVVHPATNFSFPGTGNKNATLTSLRGQAVVLLISDSADKNAFKKQVRYLEEIYQQFASKQVIFVAALKDPAIPLKSNIPFVLANDASSVATAYGTEESFNLVIIGKDGNIDYKTSKVCSGERVRDVIQNSFAVQAPGRK